MKNKSLIKVPIKRIGFKYACIPRRERETEDQEIFVNSFILTEHFIIYRPEKTAVDKFYVVQKSPSINIFRDFEWRNAL